MIISVLLISFTLPCSTQAYPPIVGQVKYALCQEVLETYPDPRRYSKTDMKQLLSFFNTGEMEPQYIIRYGFYEGHTFWRADPIAISFIFGLKNLEDLHQIFGGNLHKALTYHFTNTYEYEY